MEHYNQYLYNSAHGRLASVIGSGSSFAYEYTPNSAHLIASVTGPQHTVTNTWLPDRDSLLSKANTLASTNFSTYIYSVNAFSQRTGVALTSNHLTVSPGTGWSYDSRGQVLAADQSGGTTGDFGYAYDDMGNRKKSSRNTTDPATATGTDVANYHQTNTPDLGGNALNQYGDLNLYGAATIANTYDADGNQEQGAFPTTSSTGTGPDNLRTWDGENKLISTNVDGWLVAQYIYDAFRRRVAKSDNWSNATVTLYDGWNPIAEYDLAVEYDSGNIPWYEYNLRMTNSWGLDLSGSLQGAGGVGGLLAVHFHNWETFYPTYDGNGNVSEYIDDSGNAAAHFEYGPFGEPFNGNYFDNVGFRHSFSTKPLDWESGYYYYGYLYYDPLSGRWPSRDPIGEQGGVNLYGWCSNSPISNFDLLGLDDKGESALEKHKRENRELAEKRAANKTTFQRCREASEDEVFQPYVQSIIDDSKWNTDDAHEEGGWIVKKDGKYEIVRWDRNPENNHAINPKFPMPPGTIGDIHTHPPPDNNGPTINPVVPGGLPGGLPSRLNADPSKFPNPKNDKPFQPEHVSYVINAKHVYAVYWLKECKSDGSVVQWRVREKIIGVTSEKFNIKK